MNLRKFIKCMLRKLGLDIRLVSNIQSHKKLTALEKWKYQWNIVCDYNINTVLDIGANTGQFAQMIHELLPTAKIISFEPLKECFEELQKNMTNIPSSVAVNMALGDCESNTQINKCMFTPSSSLMDMTDTHKKAWPHTAEHQTEEIIIKRLDDITSEIPYDGPTLIKMDVQGFELKVIKGGLDTLSNVLLVAIETSFVELYKNQPLFDEIYIAMRELGFSYIGNVGELKDPKNGYVLSVDALFRNDRL